MTKQQAITTLQAAFYKAGYRRVYIKSYDYLGHEPFLLFYGTKEHHTTTGQCEQSIRGDCSIASLERYGASHIIQCYERMFGRR